MRSRWDEDSTLLCVSWVSMQVDFEAMESRESFEAETTERIFGALSAVRGPVTLVLDDFHRVSDRLASQLGTILTSWCGESRRVIVCTRMGRSELSTLFPARHAGVVVGPDQLRFTDAEIAEVLGPDLGAHVRRVAQLTGGWPQAVEMMRRSLEAEPVVGVDNAAVEIESLALAEVVPLHDPADLEVLSAASLCEGLTTGVAERASLRPGGALRLQQMANETGLVMCDSSEFSLVPVYRQALLRRLTVTQADAMRSAHVRIAEAWLDEPDSLRSTVQAIGHLIDAAEYERALSLIQLRWEQMYALSGVHLAVELIDRLPMRCWSGRAGPTLLAGWAHLVLGHSARALELLQSAPLRTPTGEVVKRLVWSYGVCWTTDPTEAIELVAEGRSRLDALDVDASFPDMPGVDTAAAFRNVADTAEAWALFFLGDLRASTEHLENVMRRPSNHRPMSVAGLHAFAAMTRAFSGDRAEAVDHLRACGAIVDQLGIDRHSLLIPADLATAVLAAHDADDAAVRRSLHSAIAVATDVGAANLLRVCELVADLAGHRFIPPDESVLDRARPLPFVDTWLAPRAARRLVGLGDRDGAAAMIAAVSPNEHVLSSWVHVLLDRHSRAEVRHWLTLQPAATTAHGRVVRSLAEAAVAEEGPLAVDHALRAVAVAAERRLVAVVADAPGALWERGDLQRIDHPLLSDARRRRRDGVSFDDDVRFTAREIELLRLMARSASAAEIAERLYLSVNTVKWHKANIYRKLEVRSASQAIERAKDLKLIADDGPTQSTAAGPRHRQLPPGAPAMEHTMRKAVGG